MRLGLMKYAGNYSTTPACRAVAGDPEGAREIHLLFLHERTNRQLEFQVVVNLTGGIISSSAPPAVNGIVFNPSGIVTNFTELFRESGQQLSTTVPVERELFAQMHAPEFRDDPKQSTLRTWDSDVPTFTVFVVQPLFCEAATAQAYVAWGIAIKAAQTVRLPTAFV